MNDHVPMLFVSLLAAVCLLGCDAKKDGAGAFVREGATVLTTDFTPVSEAEDEGDSEEQASGGAQPSSAALAGDDEDPLRRIDLPEKVNEPEEDEPEKDEPKVVEEDEPVDIDDFEPERAEPEEGPPIWGGGEPVRDSKTKGVIRKFLGATGGDEEPKIEKANSSVQQRVTFGDAPSRSRKSRVRHREWRDRDSEPVVKVTPEQVREKKRKMAELERRRLRKLEREREKREQAAEALSEASSPTPIPSATSTFSMDVDTGSYTLTGRKLARGFIPQRDEVRVEEFINFFGYDYPNPEGAFGLTVEGAPNPFRKAENHYLLRFGVKARELAPSERPGHHITLLVDVSESMGDIQSLPIVKKSIFLLLDGLDDDDRVSLVSYAAGPELVASNIPVSERRKLRNAVSRLGPSGGSSLSSGLEFASREAMQYRSNERNSRLIVFADGEVNMGETRAVKLARKATGFQDAGLALTVLGVGDSRYDDAFLELLANRGDGTYHHVNAMPEAERLFGRELQSTLYTVAEDAKIQVEFDEENVVSYRRVGYDNRALPDEFFRRDDVDGGEVGAGQSVTALYEVELSPRADGELGRLSVRYNEPDGEDGRELAAGFHTRDLKENFAKATDDFRFAAALAAFGEILLQSELGRSLNIDAVIEVAEGASGEDGERHGAVYLMRRVIELAD